MGRDSNQLRLTRSEIHRDLKKQVIELSNKLNNFYFGISKVETKREIQKRAAEPLIDDMVRNAPSVRIADSIEVYEPPRGHNTWVGPNYKKGGELSWIFEYGTVDRFKRDGSYTGEMNSHPFVRPAYNRQKLIVLSILEREMNKKIDERIKYLRGT